MKNNNIKKITRGAVVAALYCVLTLLFQPISFGAIQFRVAEALTLLPLLTFDAVPGLFVGCLLANILGGAPLMDVVFGSLATLIAAVLTWILRNRRYIAAGMPALLNGLIVGPVVYYCYVKAPEDAFNLGVMLFNIGTVAFGEIVVCYVLGVLMIMWLERRNAKNGFLN